jgi:starch synthase (maltosyl-transferring)
MDDLTDLLSGSSGPIRFAPRSSGAKPEPMAAYLECAVDECAFAANLGFNGVLFWPFGKALHWNELGSWQKPPQFQELACLLGLPWQTHHRLSSLRREHPDWFENRSEDRRVIDPRRPDGWTAGNKIILTGDAGRGYAERLADEILMLIERGADKIFLPEAETGPFEFWSALCRRLGPKVSHLLLEFNDDTARIPQGLETVVTRRQAPLQSAKRSIYRASPMGEPDLPALLRAFVRFNGLLWHRTHVEALGTDRTRALLKIASKTPAQSSIQSTNGLRDVVTRRLNAEDVFAFGPDRRSIVRKLSGQFDTLTELVTMKDGTLMRGRKTQSRKSAPKKDGQATMDHLAKERVAIENVYPVIDGGRFPAKRIVGDLVEVAADIFTDGHEKLAADLVVREPGQDPVRIRMKPIVNDRWLARCVLEKQGLTHFDIEAWRDRAATWRDEVRKKMAAGQQVDLETEEGLKLIKPQLRDIASKKGSSGEKATKLLALVDETKGRNADLLQVLLDDSVHQLLRDHGERHQAVHLQQEVKVRVDREKARFSSWYELFPRSMTDDEHRHGTFRDVIDRLPYIRDLGFDVLYFPPIHPIGKTNRKGRNNSLTAEEGDVGSPYAIGSEEGGHDALHPELGDFDDFAALLAAAEEHGMEVALDFAIQCSPDHPWLKEHKDWFDWRPDGSLKYAENPPKKYEDIVNVNFYGSAYPDVWKALRDVVLFWCEKGVRIYRVDNPHTKPYPFWEWLIDEVKNEYPDALFLSEAFTRPKVMKRLAKLGFTQSYTYFTWRDTKHELEDYLRELTQTDTREVMNPNFFVNTPDINPGVLQSNNRDAYIARTWLAGTLASSYGIYNGVEIAKGTPLPGKEEYLDSEKYQIRIWDMDREGHIKDEIRLLNQLRSEHPALRDHVSLRFLNAYNDRILWYAKATPDCSDVVLIAVSLDFENDQSATIEIPLWYYGLPDDATIDAYDVFARQDFQWHGKMQRIELGPGRIVRAFVLSPPHGFEFKDHPLYSDPEASK